MAVEAWETISSKTAFQSKWYTLRQDTIRLPDGNIIDDYFVSVRPDVVITFAVTVDSYVLLVRQYKQGVQQITLELPAGTFTRGTAIDAAKRELLEETGYACDQLIHIATIFDDSSKNSNLVHIFLGTNATEVALQNLKENEVAGGIDVEKIHLSDILSKVRAGEISSQSSVVGIYRCMDELSLAR